MFTKIIIVKKTLAFLFFVFYNKRTRWKRSVKKTDLHYDSLNMSDHISKPKYKDSTLKEWILEV